MLKVYATRKHKYMHQQHRQTASESVAPVLVYTKKIKEILPFFS